MKNLRTVLLLACVCALLAGCTNAVGALGALLDAGYTNVIITGYKAFSCGQDDTFATGFVATGPSGRRVSGTVCEAFFKGKTIRLD